MGARCGSGDDGRCDSLTRCVGRGWERSLVRSGGRSRGPRNNSWSDAFTRGISGGRERSIVSARRSPGDDRRRNSLTRGIRRRREMSFIRSRC